MALQTETGQVEPCPEGCGLLLRRRNQAQIGPARSAIVSDEWALPRVRHLSSLIACCLHTPTGAEIAIASVSELCPEMTRWD